ncbi:MAG TPA: methyltransferase domain-containing protein [Candidatus Binataceae bacterium]|nr:methyltransferase domain-containing protein [Candidatus Binataceae bacterium]
MADLRPEFFRRIDESDDELFYQYPRLVTHIDDGAIDKVGEIYADLLPAGGEILDLMSSWRSHIPASVKPRRLVGLGLNYAEMGDNPALTEIVVHNVNREPHLPFADESFDGAVMTVSVQYLVRPVETFAEVGRILRPHAPFIVTFSNRMFPAKAIALWQHASEAQRVTVVETYFARTEAFDSTNVIDRSLAEAAPSDPIWAVAARKRI